MGVGRLAAFALVAIAGLMVAAFAVAYLTTSPRGTLVNEGTAGGTAWRATVHVKPDGRICIDVAEFPFIGRGTSCYGPGQVRGFSNFSSSGSSGRMQLYEGLAPTTARIEFQTSDGNVTITPVPISGIDTALAYAAAFPMTTDVFVVRMLNSEGTEIDTKLGLFR